MARITVDLSQLANLSRRVTTVIEAAGMTRMRQELAADTLRQHQQRFTRRVTPDGERWRPRKDSKPHPLLEETGELRRSIRVVTGGPPGIEVSGYAAVHQYGSDRIPAREYLGFGDSDLDELTMTADDWLGRFFGQVLR